MGRKVGDIRPKNFATPNELKGRHFYIADAIIKENPWHPDQEVIEISYRLQQWRQGSDPMPPQGTLTMGAKGREWVADAFSSEKEEIGPVTLVEQFLTSGNRFWSIVDVVEGQPEGATAEPLPF